jgi:hypothetical protein
LSVVALVSCRAIVNPLVIVGTVPACDIEPEGTADRDSIIDGACLPDSEHQCANNVAVPACGPRVADPDPATGQWRCDGLPHLSE